MFHYDKSLQLESRLERSELLYKHFVGECKVDSQSKLHDTEQRILNLALAICPHVDNQKSLQYNLKAFLPLYIVKTMQLLKTIKSPSFKPVDLIPICDFRNIGHLKFDIKMLLKSICFLTTDESISLNHKTHAAFLMQRIFKVSSSNNLDLRTHV